MITVFGASGNTGKVVASALLKRGAKVRVVARDQSKVADLVAQGAEVFAGDVLDAKSVAAALDGASGAYLIVPPDATSADLVKRGRAIVDNYAAALSANTSVKHAAVLSSIAAQQPAGTGPVVIVHYAEQQLAKRAPGVHYTFVRAAYFMENLLAYAHAMKSDGVLPVFGGGEGYAFPMVATRDIGEVAAEALLAPPGETQWIELSGPREYSFSDAAEAAGKSTGRAVKPLALPIEAMVPALTKVGLSENVAGLYREMTEASGKGLFVFEGKGRAVRGKVTLEEVLAPALK